MDDGFSMDLEIVQIQAYALWHDLNLTSPLFLDPPSRDIALTMAPFEVPSFDLTQYPIPVQSFIDGRFVDSSGNDKHTLTSSLNDDVVTTGMRHLMIPSYP